MENAILRHVSEIMLKAMERKNDFKKLAVLDMLEHEIAQGADLVKDAKKLFENAREIWEERA